MEGDISKRVVERSVTAFVKVMKGKCVSMEVKIGLKNSIEQHSTANDNV